MIFIIFASETVKKRTSSNTSAVIYWLHHSNVNQLISSHIQKWPRIIWSNWIGLKSTLKTVDNNTNHTNYFKWVNNCLYCSKVSRNQLCHLYSMDVVRKYFKWFVYVILCFDLCYCFHFVWNVRANDVQTCTIL